MNARILVVDDSPTLRRVVASMLASRSFDPVVASGGQEALEILETEPVNLVLLDFRMPGMDGYEFCRELRAHPKYRGLPVVLMSAKADAISGSFLGQTGALGSIAKPFDAAGLTAVVRRALDRSASWAPDRTPAAVDWAEELVTLLGPELQRLEGLGSPATSLPQLLQQALTPGVVHALKSRIRLCEQRESPEALSGDIAAFSVAEVLQLLSLQRQTGELAVLSPRGEITLYLREGLLDFAAWRGLRDEFLIGRYLSDSNALSADALRSAVQATIGSERLLGETLLDRQVVTEDQVQRALVRQTSELIYEAVRWNSGRFLFTVGVSSRMSEKARLGLETSALMMEGFRRVDEWRVIERSFDMDEILRPDPAAIEHFGGEAKLTEKERAVLAEINGERSIREALERVSGGSFELCKIVYQLLNSRLVRRRAAA